MRLKMTKIIVELFVFAVTVAVLVLALAYGLGIEQEVFALVRALLQ